MHNQERYGISPIKMADKILSHIQEYAPQVVGREEDFAEIKLVNVYGEELWIQIDDAETSLFFGDWHTHYVAFPEAYAHFIDDLSEILSNRKCTICSYAQDLPRCSMLSDTVSPDIADLREEFGADKTIRLHFWDSSRDIVYEPLKQD